MSTDSLTIKQTDSGYRWVILTLCALTPLCVITLPNMSLPPLFTLIGDNLNLTLVEIGVIWGAVSFTGIFFALIGGSLGDRFGTRVMLFATCLLTGLFGLTRSFARDFDTLMLATILFGIFQAAIPVLLFKVVRHWFPARQLGMASGVTSAGFAAGLMLGPLLSTSVILPALGGWRQVLIFYGVVAVLLSLVWLIVHPTERQPDANARPRVSLGDSLRYVVQLRDVWILGIGGLGITACFQGFTGYLPTYLKTVGWAELDADRALSAFFMTSLIAVIPLSFLSDRLRLRRGFLIVASLILSIGVGLLSVVEGTVIVLVMAATGIIFDSLMAILNASVLEADGVTHLYAGTAIGFATMLRNLGGTFSPPVGNSLTSLGLSVPFLFWGGMGLFAAVMFAFVLRSKTTAALEGQSADLPLSTEG
ncbi:MAG: MFS transporter [Anaerolineae bacterium]|nr:MFS transporter [Anaerolineae bacterium]